MMFFSKPDATWSDDRLVSAVLSGNRDAIVYMFYEKFSSTFLYHIHKLFASRVDVQELVDEFFLYLFEDDWRRLRTFDFSKSSLNTWISTVSFRFFRDYKHSVIESGGHITINDKWESFVGDWVQSRDAGLEMDVRTVIEGIKNDRDRKIATGLFIEDREYEAVAEEFALNVDYVYTIKNRILKQLRKGLESYR